MEMNCNICIMKNDSEKLLLKIWSDAEYQQVDIKPQQQHQTHTYTQLCLHKAAKQVYFRYM